MHKTEHLALALALGVCTVSVGACGGGHDRAANTVAGDVATPSAAPSAATTPAVASPGESVAPA